MILRIDVYKITCDMCGQQYDRLIPEEDYNYPKILDDLRAEGWLFLSSSSALIIYEDKRCDLRELCPGCAEKFKRLFPKIFKTEEVKK